MKAEVITGICGHKVTIEANMRPSGTIKLSINSDCKSIQMYSEKLAEIKTMDACKPPHENPLYLAATCLTPNCPIPCAALNLIWIEMGMISKRLALQNKIEIAFIE